MKKGAVITILKGCAIGASMLIPGVSGGTAAIVLGIYDDILRAVSRFAEEKKKNAVYLLQVGGGMLIGILLLATPLLSAVTAFPMPMMFLFLGAIVGSIPTLLKKTAIRTYRSVHFLYFLIGLASVLGLSRLPKLGGGFSEAGSFGFSLLLLAGLSVAVALILPGISASYMLLLFGLYEITLSAVHRLQFLFLAPLLIGVLVGILLTARVLETAMRRFPDAAYLTIAGFVAGSVIEVFPGFPVGMDILLSAVALLIGFFGVFFLSKRAKEAE